MQQPQMMIPGQQFAIHPNIEQPILMVEQHRPGQPVHQQIIREE